jgi:hypothetical protein
MDLVRVSYLEVQEASRVAGWSFSTGGWAPPAPVATVVAAAVPLCATWLHSWRAADALSLRARRTVPAPRAVAGEAGYFADYGDDADPQDGKGG